MRETACWAAVMNPSNACFACATLVSAIRRMSAEISKLDIGSLAIVTSHGSDNQRHL